MALAIAERTADQQQARDREVVGASVGLAGLATAAGGRAAREAGRSSPAAALAAGYDLVFLIAAGPGLALAEVSLLLPRHRRG
jgi:hypothetical protein